MEWPKRHMTSFSRIIGTGSYLPPHRVSNNELVSQLAKDGIESSDDWIVERTGIRARYFVDEQTKTFIYESRIYTRYLPKTNEIIWTSEQKLFLSPVSVNGIKIGSTVYPFSQVDILIISTVIIVMLTFAFFFQRTSLGLSLRAAAFQPEISRLAGIRVDRVRTIGWALSGAAGAIVGVLVTPGSYLSPFSLDILLVYGFVAAVIGGLESPQGAALGGLILGMSLSFTSIYVNSGLTFIVPFVVLLLILIIKPKGIFGGGSSRNA